MAIRKSKQGKQDVYTQGSKWAYVDEIFGNGRKYGYYVASGSGSRNNATKNFKKKSLANAFARNQVK